MILQYESGNPQILGLVVGADVQRSAAILLQLWARVRPAFNRAVCSLQTLHLVRTQSLLQDQGLRLAEAQCPSVGHNILIQIDNCALKYFRGVGITDKECSCMFQIIQIGRDSIQSLFSVYQE